MLILLGVTLFLYAIFMVCLLAGWKRVFAEQPPGASLEEFISVIIPVRNEEKGIRSLLHDLARQQYASFEIIIVNDHSEDQTESIIHEFGSSRIKCIQNQGAGKKHALTTGIAVASGAIIATTDADCHVPPGWLASLNRFIADDSVKMLIGPVSVEGRGDLFSHMQQIEFASLVGTTAATSAFNRPVMCNGANLAFRKEIFESVSGYEGNFHISSGDDEFLLRKILDRWPEGVRFVTDNASVIRTLPQRSVDDFIHQRLRWAGKWRHNSSYFTLLVAMIVLAIQVCSIIFYFNFFRTMEFKWLVFAMIRFCSEAYILQKFCYFLRVRWHWPAFVTLFLIYPFYVTYVAISSNFLSYSWKGRMYRT